MPHRIAERLREIAVKCAKLSDVSKDKIIADELEGIAVELAQKAQKLDNLFNLLEKAS